MTGGGGLSEPGKVAPQPSSSGLEQAAQAGRPQMARRRRAVAFWVGLVLVLAGLGTLGYVAWELYGTTIVSRQTQQRIVDELESEWSAPAGRSSQPDAWTAKENRPRLGDATALIRIPAFGDGYVTPVIEGIGDAELARGFGHFPGTANPGERGNYALAGHRITHGEPLRDMPELRPGHEVIVETRDAVFTYELVTNPNDLVVTFEDVWVVDPLPTNPDGGVQPAQKPGQRLITLTTCAELFATDYRMIVFGQLVDTERK